MTEELKLGKLPAKEDPKRRTIRLSSILVKKYLPALPGAYDIDAALGGIDDNRGFGNNQYGNCVIAARAHQTFRFEKFEQGQQIDITDQEVIDQYFKETGGGDWGLNLLQSLKAWRKTGWPVGDKNYTIYAFASVDWKKHTEVKHCIHLLHGINFGMRIYQKDMDQFSAGEPWHLTEDSGQFRGGHGVYGCQYNTYIGRRLMPTIKLLGYDQFGIWCMTWGRKHFMTWDFWDARVDEAYGIVDDRNEWMAEDSPVDVGKLDGYLKEITGDGEEPEKPGCPFWPIAIIKRICKYGDLSAAPEHLEFQAKEGWPYMLASQKLYIKKVAGSGQLPARWEIYGTSIGHWLDVRPGNGRGGKTVRVYADPRALVAGEYQGKILLKVTSGSAKITPSAIPAILTVKGDKPPEPPPPDVFKCNHRCGKEFDTEAKLIDHIRKEHEDE